jgi:hypothetical protein
VKASIEILLAKRLKKLSFVFKNLLPKSTMPKRRFTRESRIRKGSVLDSISGTMVAVGTLLKEKGGPMNQELQGKIKFWADGGGCGSVAFSFPDVLKIVWGEDEEEGTDEDNVVGSAVNGVSHGVKSGFSEIDGDE